MKLIEKRKNSKAFIVTTRIMLMLLIGMVVYPYMLAVVESFTNRNVNVFSEGECRIWNTSAVLRRGEGEIFLGKAFDGFDSQTHVWGKDKDGKILDFTCPGCAYTSIFIRIHLEDGKIASIDRYAEGGSVDFNLAYLKTFIFMKQVRTAFKEWRKGEKWSGETVYELNKGKPPIKNI